MKITCESCGAKYTIADDKVLGRKVKIRCKGCSTPIVVDGQKLGPSGAPPGGGDVKPETIVPSPSTLIPTPASEWSVNFSETDQRTLSTQQILEGYQAGQIPADVYVWRDGMADWAPLLECAELAPLLAGGPALAAAPVEAPLPPGYGAEPAAAAPAAFPAPEAEPAAAPEAPAAAPEPAPPEPAPVAAPAAAKSAPRAATAARTHEASASVTPEPATGSRTSAAARVSGGRSAGAHDLFAGVETAGAENLEIPIAAPVLPQAGSTSYNDDRPTGARNENSVLFSLDSMKATNLAPAPKAGARPAADDPFGMGASSGSVASIGGGNALFTLADNQRLLSAPPPPPEPPPKAVAVASAMPSLAPAAMTKKTLGIVIGAVVAVLLLGVGIGVAVGGGDKDKSEGEASSATAAEASAAPEEKKPEEKAEKKEEPAAPPAESATAKAEEKPAEEAKGGAASTTPQPGTKPTPGKPAPKKEEAPAPVVADQPFNRGAAVSAMSAAASQAASCKKPGGPTGSGKATLTFAPTGRVTSATVTTPPFAGTAVGGCVAGVFRRAKVPPFTGNSITVSKSFTIN